MLLKRRTALAIPAVVLLAMAESVAPVRAQSTDTPIAPEISALAGVLRGSGSTFAARYYSAVALALSGSAKAVKIEYRAVGSGRGKAEFGKNLTDFAGTAGCTTTTKPALPMPTTACTSLIGSNVNL